MQQLLWHIWQAIGWNGIGAIAALITAIAALINAVANAVAALRKTRKHRKTKKNSDQNYGKNPSDKPKKSHGSPILDSPISTT